jgi:putative membrane protein
MMDWNGNSGGWGAGMVIMVVFFVALIALAVWAVVRLSRRTDEPARSAESPRQILDRRFASGELDESQYAQARRVLDGRGVLEKNGATDASR